jgi:hypothetical protein
MRRISIAPANRRRRLVVLPDVPTSFPREVGDRGEDAPGEQIPFDLGEPELDLIEPRRIRGREVQPHVGVRDQEGPHRLRFVGRQIVENHVDLAPLRLTGNDVAEERNKGRAGVPRHGLRELCLPKTPYVLHSWRLQAFSNSLGSWRPCSFSTRCV